MIELSAHGKSYTVTLPTEDVMGSRIGSVISQGRPYEEPLLQEIHSLGLSGLAVDVGAHIGNHSLWFAVVCGLWVEAFEPDLEAFRTLATNVSVNELGDRIHIHNVALSDQDSGVGEWDPNIKGAVRPSETGIISMWTLDSYALPNVCLIKVDVEGYEPQVLEGATRTIKRHRPVIYAEARSKAARQRIGEVLEPLGYELDHLVEVATPLGCWRHHE